MMEEIVEAGIQFRAHQEQTTINGGKHHELRKATYKISLEEIEVAFFKEPKEHHAEQVFKNTDWGKDMEETVLGIVTVEPKIIGKAKERSPQNSRNKERSKKHPKCAVTLLEKPAAEPRSHRVAHEKAGKGPRRFIQFHAEIRHDRPSERQMQKKASPRVCHFSKASSSAVANFREARQMSIAAKFKDKHHKHEKRHEEVQAVKFGDTGEHEGDNGDLAFGVAEFACEQEACEHVEDAGGKGGRIHDGHDPLVIGHVVEGRGRTQVKHHNVNACEESKAIESREVIRFCFFHIEVIKIFFIITLIREI